MVPTCTAGAARGALQSSVRRPPVLQDELGGMVIFL
jgi:hypothetical protein